MKKVFYFMLGVFLITLTSATTVSVMTVKPATPKQFIVKDFQQQGDSKDVALFIKEQIRKGWILKSVSGANYSQTQSTWIVVLEKS